MSTCSVCGEEVAEWEKACPLCGTPIYNDPQILRGLATKREKSFMEQVFEVTSMLAVRLVSIAIAAGATVAAVKIAVHPPLNAYFPGSLFIAFGIGIAIYFAIREIVDLIRGALGIGIRYSLVWQNALFENYSGSSMAVAILIVTFFSIVVTLFTDAALLVFFDHVFRWFL